MDKKYFIVDLSIQSIQKFLIIIFINISSNYTFLLKLASQETNIFISYY